MTVPARIGGRYDVLSQLGRGGSAYVYHVRDISSGRELALKRLRHDIGTARIADLTQHLEREFYVLAQLRHPRVIDVYDYGVSEGLPYYTMELLDGGDVRATAPLPWRRACELIYDVASSLALLHSRRFVHRDVTPSNIRCTRDGRAKLIDFGAMAPMGTGADVIGTPAYVAPEVQQRGALDPGTDLFSLGATLYFLVTAKPPFAATDLANMPAAWAIPPCAPSELDPEIPAAFDALVLSLLSIDPAHRPRTAFEVMQRVAALAGLPMSESANVSQGYLSAPQVVGRAAALRSLRAALQRTLVGSGSALWLEGDAGVGRSRLLELCTLEAMTAGATVLRLDASEGGTAFESARHLAAALLTALPELARAELPGSTELNALIEGTEAGMSASRATVSDALTRWMITVSASAPIVIAIDDVQRVDEPTLAWLAALAHAAPGAKLLLIMTAESDAVRDTPGALAVLKRHSAVLPVLPLTHAESDAMFSSVFGAVPNLALVSERIFALAAGNPRRSLALAQYLVDEGYISYAAGAWTLPDELAPEVLAVDVEASIAARIARVGALARRLAETQALSLAVALRCEDYQVLAPDADARSLDDALSELIAHQIVRGDSVSYVFSNRAYRSALLELVDPRVLAERHEALARLAEKRQRHVFVIAYHRLHAGQDTAALDLFSDGAVTDIAQIHDLDPKSVSAMLERALSVSEALGRPKRERFDLMHRLAQASLVGDAKLYRRLAPLLRARLEEDTGLRAYRAHEEIRDPAERLRTALVETAANYANTPEHERVYTVEEAFRGTIIYVLTSIAIGTRYADSSLLGSLPGLLQPFASLSPVLEAVYENAEAVCDFSLRARPERAIRRWQRVYDLLEPSASTPGLKDLRPAVAIALGYQMALLGVSAAALDWIARLDQDPLQRVNAMRLRRVLCLQHGDWAGAERAREHAELMALQASGRQVFEPPLLAELSAHWFARDLAGVKQTVESLGRILPDRPGWHGHHRLALGYFEALRGDAGGALVLFDEVIASSQPDVQEQDRRLDLWTAASAAAVSMLLELGRTGEARSRAEDVLAQCRALEITVCAQRIECELALAEARSGDGPLAIERVERVIADQRERGVSGLQLATTYETRARIAMSLRQQDDVMRYAALAAREYRHGAGSSVASRYGRLLQEARSAGVQLPPEVSAFAAALAPAAGGPNDSAIARVLDETSGSERARRVLDLLCERAEATAGHLYLAQGPSSELTWIASTSASPPPQPAARFVAAYWEQQLEEAEMSAVLTELPWSRETYRPGRWCDPHGKLHEVVLLYDPRALPSHVGLALLEIGERPRNAEWPTTMLSALAAGLSSAALST
jgi:hypothetical protein